MKARKTHNLVWQLLQMRGYIHLVLLQNFTKKNVKYNCPMLQVLDCLLVILNFVVFHQFKAENVCEFKSKTKVPQVGKLNWIIRLAYCHSDGRANLSNCYWSLYLLFSTLIPYFYILDVRVQNGVLIMLAGYQNFLRQKMVKTIVGFNGSLELKTR